MQAESTVLVTGVTGFIGSRIAERLRQERVKVRGLVRREADIPGVDTRLGDMTDRASLQRAAAGADAVIHCAVSFSRDFEEARAVQVDGTRDLAEAALEAGCEHFIHVSTGGAYDIRGVDEVDEETPTWPYDPDDGPVYGVTKAEAERVVLAAVEEGLPAVILRPHNVLGGHPRSAWTVRIVDAIEDDELAVYGDPERPWPYVDVENFVDAVMAALETPAAVGEAYTVIDGHVPWGEYLQQFVEWLDAASLEERPARGLYDRWDGRFLNDKAQRDLGWGPRRSYEEALADIEGYLRQGGHLGG